MHDTKSIQLLDMTLEEVMAEYCSMGCEIVLSCTPVNESDVTVNIPITPCDAPLTATAKAELMGVKKILLADDEEFGRMVVATLLKRKGHQVTEVSDGAQLLEVLECGRFDILITDISMPVMEGTEVARIIRSGEKKNINRHIPIIAMTAHAVTVDCERLRDVGIHGYISKPFNFEELLGLIDEVCSTGIVVTLPEDYQNVAAGTGIYRFTDALSGH